MKERSPAYGKTAAIRGRDGQKTRRWALGRAHRRGAQGKRRPDLPARLREDAESPDGKAAPEHRMLSGRGADRGQPHDAGRVAGPLARGIQGRHDPSGHAGRLPELYRKLHQAAARRQAGFAHHDAGRAADVPAAEIRRARARGRGGQQAALRFDRAAHPHDAARRDEGCGAGAHHSEKSDRERNCAEIQTTSRCRC